MSEENNINKILGRTQEWDREEITRLSSEAAALRADLARVTGERDAALAEVGRVREACSVYRETFRATLVAGFQSGPMACNEEQAKAQADSVLATMDTALTPPAQQSTRDAVESAIDDSKKPGTWASLTKPAPQQEKNP